MVATNSIIRTMVKSLIWTWIKQDYCINDNLADFDYFNIIIKVYPCS